MPTEGRVTIGRSNQADIRIEDPSISRLHATLHVGRTLRIEDMESGNGTRLLAWQARPSPSSVTTRKAGIADHTVKPGTLVPITAGHVVQLGSTTLVVQRAPASPKATPFMSHGYLETRLGEECLRAERAGGGVALLRVRIESSATAEAVENALAEATGPDALLAAYAPGTYDVLLLDADRVRTATVQQRIDARLRAGKRSPRVAIARFPEDGRSAHALLAVAAARMDVKDETKSTAVVACDPAMLRLFALAERVARGTIPVLLIGETGAGKEVLAEMVHRSSPRARRPFLRLNCGAFSESLLESELFGHERGAFTGASRSKSGLLESAKGGTVFLDEIGELPLSLQVKLLRVLEDDAVLPVGSVRARRIDVRFVSATNRDLDEEVRAGRFREDLYFRINGACLFIPPLRERPSEIEPLVRNFLSLSARRAGRSRPPDISPEAVEWLRDYTWPGNVRELRNVIERALLLCGAGTIGLEHLPTEVGRVRPREASSAERRTVPPPFTEASVPLAHLTGGGPVSSADLATMFKDIEREQTIRALESCAGNQTRAAKLLGISRRTLINRLEAYQLARPRKGSS